MKKVFLEKGVKNCLIVIPEDFSPVEKNAAEELQDYIEKSLAVKLDIVTESKVEGKCIFVGQTEKAKGEKILGKSKENWIIKMVDGSLVLTGGVEKMDRGIIYAAYHFLEDFVGVRWWSPFEEDVLSLSELALDDDLFAEGTPVIAHRKPYMHSGVGLEGVAHMARSRTNVISPLDDKIENGVYDPEVRKYGDFQHAGRPHHAHTASKYFPRKDYFDAHPDWWAWNKREGRRLPEGGRCLTNPGLREAFLEKLMGFIEEDIKLAEETGAEIPCYYSLSQDDIDEDFFCECDECQKIIQKSGYSGYLIQFVNWIAREVAKKYPDIKIEYLAYLNFAEPPKDDTLPDPNVITRLAHLRGDIMHGVTAKSNEKYLELLKKWSEVAKKSGTELYIWDYMYNFILNYPAPFFYRIKDTVKSFYNYGVSGVFVETQNPYPDLWLLNHHLLTHLLENPELDEKVLIHDFIMRYYGDAGKYIEEYTELLWETSLKYMTRVYCVKEGSPFNYIDYKAALRGFELLEKAAAAVSGKAPFEERVGWLRKSMDVTILLKYFDLKRMAKRDGVAFEFDRQKLKDHAISAVRAHMKLPYNATRYATFENEIKYIESIEIGDEKKFDIPEALKGENPEDIYQFHLTEMTQFINKPMKRIYAQSNEVDEAAACGKTSKFACDKAGGMINPVILRPTSKNAEVKNGLRFFIRKNDTIVEDTRLYMEDITLGGYNLYKIGSATEVSDKNDVRLWMFADGDLTINISGIAVNFPMNDCDVYLSMKFEGEMYGGDASDENAIYIDRLIVVKTK